MQFTILERQASRNVTTGKNKTIELQYIVMGVTEGGDEVGDHDAFALAALTAAVEDTIAVDGETLVRTKRHIEPIARWTVEATDKPGQTMLWDGFVTYERFNWTPPETEQSTFSFDTGGGTQHITQSISTIAKYPVDTAPDCKGAIGVGQSGDSLVVEGVDIVVPVYNWSETHYLANATVTAAYKQTLFGLTGKVNDDTFKGFAAGEVLFLGASGSQRGAEDWEVSFRFAASKNKTGLTIGAITNIAKAGWEYLWVRYKNSTDKDMPVQIPAAVYIEQVYEPADFSGLGIGTT